MDRRRDRVGEPASNPCLFFGRIAERQNREYDFRGRLSVSQPDAWRRRARRLRSRSAPLSDALSLARFPFRDRRPADVATVETLPPLRPVVYDMSHLIARLRAQTGTGID